MLVMLGEFETGRPTAAIPTGVRTRDDFGEFLLRILAEFRDARASEWTNSTLEQFLDGLSAFALARVNDDSEQEDASWQLFAEMIHAASGYEQDPATLVS